MKNNGGNAFPNSCEDWKGSSEGMSLRAYFAAKALQGMLSYPGAEGNGSHHSNNTPKGVALMAVSYADAMIEALEND